jgi:hypothetical protein
VSAEGHPSHGGGLVHYGQAVSAGVSGGYGPAVSGDGYYPQAGRYPRYAGPKVRRCNLNALN